jgi:hypothetical protein
MSGNPEDEEMRAPPQGPYLRLVVARRATLLHLWRLGTASIDDPTRMELRDQGR